MLRYDIHSIQSQYNLCLCSDQSPPITAATFTLVEAIKSIQTQPASHEEPIATISQPTTKKYATVRL